jgi:putative Mg2+ transporter-C (MgtC) family protein
MCKHRLYYFITYTIERLFLSFLYLKKEDVNKRRIVMFSSIDYDVLIKLGITAALGLIIGLKTCLVISIISCLLTIVSIDSAYKSTGSDSGVNITMDPLRLAAQIVSGIGFLGAGVILRRGNDTISGLTTAAIIWGAAGIGIAVGANFYLEAIAGVILIIISVEFLPAVMTYIGPKQLKEKEISLEITLNDHQYVNEIIEAIKEKNFSIHRIRIRDLKDGKHLLSLKVGINYKLKITEVYAMITKLKSVEFVEIESINV